MVGLLVTSQASSHFQCFTTILPHARHRIPPFFESTFLRSSSTEPLSALFITTRSILTAPFHRYSAYQREIQWNQGLSKTLVSPPGRSLNNGIPRDAYLSNPRPINYDYPESIALWTLAVVFKTDLRRAYRQIPVDPHYHLLGMTVDGFMYFNTAMPFGLQSATLAWQRTTKGVVYEGSSLPISCWIQDDYSQLGTTRLVGYLSFHIQCMLVE